jgi:hypothetical protein
MPMMLTLPVICCTSDNFPTSLGFLRKRNHVGSVCVLPQSWQTITSEE